MMNVTRLKDIREDNDINQVKISKILNVNRSTYSLWELGINIIPLKYLYVFANYFNMSIDYVLGLSNNKKNTSTDIVLNLKTLGNNMKTVRLKNNLSQENVGDMLGVTQACIARYEKGLICISTSNLYKFSKKFNISFNSLCNKVKN